MKYQVGDRVVIGENAGWGIVSDGMVVTIAEVNSDGYFIHEDCTENMWYDCEIDHEATARLREQESKDFSTGYVSNNVDTEKVTIPFTDEEVDMVNHPPHYTRGRIEVIDFIEDKDLGFHLGNVVKYVARAGYKLDRVEDLKKARFYLDRFIEQQEKLAEVEDDEKVL